MSIKASDDFDVKTYEYSDTAQEKGIDNSAPPDVLDDLQALHHNIVVPVVQQFGPCWISSGYRGSKLNEAVGSRNIASQHTKGQACDLVPCEKSVKDLFNFVIAVLPYDQVIYESYGGKRWVHVSFDKGRSRRMAMRTDDGKNFTIQGKFEVA